MCCLCLVCVCVCVWRFSFVSPTIKNPPRLLRFWFKCRNQTAIISASFLLISFQPTFCICESEWVYVPYECMYMCFRVKISVIKLWFSPAAFVRTGANVWFCSFQFGCSNLLPFRWGELLNDVCLCTWLAGRVVPRRWKLVWIYDYSFRGCCCLRLRKRDTQGPSLSRTKLDLEVMVETEENMMIMIRTNMTRERGSEIVHHRGGR